MNRERKESLISIIVPVYQAKEYIRKCIDSVLRQTYDNLEIILVDDGSSDGSGEICDRYQQSDSRIQVIHQANGGLVSARQAGIAAASGAYIGFADADDWMEPNMYQKLYDTAAAENADIVAESFFDDYGGRCIFVSNRISSGIYRTDREREALYKTMICCSEFFCMGLAPYLWNKLFRRELVLGHMLKIPSEIRVGEDAAALYPMAAAASCIAVCDTAHYHYCHHENSMILGERDENAEYKNTVLLDRFLRKSFLELGMSGTVNEQLKRYFVNNLMVRSFGKIAALNQKNILYPFEGLCEGDSIFVYGAGALGREVYRYAVSCKKLTVKSLVDQNAVYYKKIGISVCTPDEMDLAVSDKIVIAVFREDAYQAIRNSLLAKGAGAWQIKWIDSRAAARLAL